MRQGYELREPPDLRPHQRDVVLDHPGGDREELLLGERPFQVVAVTTGEADVGCGIAAA
jgi:hypothetical protein